MSDNALVVAPQDSTTWSTGLGLVDDVHQVADGIHSNSWVDGTLGGVGASLDILSMVVDPLGTLVSWGVSWLMEHVKPLKEALDWLAGNADEIAAHAATWKNVATFTARAQSDFAARLRTEVSGWFGSSADAYRGHAEAHLSALDGISTAASGISYAVEGAGLLVGLVRGIVRDLIADFVGTLAARLPQWLAEEGITLGLATPVVVGQVAALVAKWVNKIQHFVRALLGSLRRLSPMLDKLGEGITGLRDLLRRLAKSDPVSPKPVKDPLGPKKPEDYEFNMVENPGPLAEGDAPPAANFAGGRYDEVTLAEDRILYRGGDSTGNGFGRWFTTEPPQSVAEVRIDTAVKPQWLNADGSWNGASPIDSVFAVRIPAGTKVYVGPVGSMGGVHVGGGNQIYIESPWNGGVVVGSTPLP
ncbi:WXG100 family type VII secretion target [Winogradskya humida]|uniref:WXG100 family type VII secretion target n=1 Tax=Winogradskya humida TaxID=113566 RepID=A0ABQ3ZZ19_9ACTN|nr:hypothetical protein [Actinoplanes humidus]GIE23392.1 hypothetical protein Ahu01nite_064940 [Actinoplanes humidus]